MPKEIPLTQNKTAIVDNQDYDYLMQWKWYAKCDHKISYAVRNIRVNGKRILARMHVIIAKRAGIKGKEIDHQDRNGLNNRRSNLRAATHGQNMANRVPKTKSGYKGVYPHGNSWVVYMTANKQHLYLGSFTDKHTAARAYNTAAKKYFGKFCVLNKISLDKSQ
jgi:hypothetical protein